MAPRIARSMCPPRIIAKLWALLKKLAPAQRELINATYGSGISIKDASATLGRTPTALYKTLARIRDNLHGCIEKTLAKIPA